MSVLSGVNALDNGLRNLIIGGNFATNPWQRGTSFAALANNTYCADRWKLQNSSGAVATLSKAADGPTVAQSGLYIPQCLSAAITTADTSIAAGEYFTIVQSIEGYNFSRIAQRVFVLSFWVKSTVTGTYCVGFTNSGSDRSFVAEYTVNTTNTWERKVLPILASTVAGTWDYTTGVGVNVFFTVAAGSTFQTTAGAWQTGNFIATSNQVNGVSSTSNVFKIAHVQLESGTDATQFEERDPQVELALALRYYEKSFPIAVAPAQNAGFAGAGEWRAAVGSSLSSGINPRFAVRKRVSPTVVTYNPSAANAQGRNVTSNTDCTGTVAVVITDNQFLLGVTTPLVGSTVGDEYGCHWTADADF